MPSIPNVLQKKSFSLKPKDLAMTLLAIVIIVMLVTFGLRFGNFAVAKTTATIVPALPASVTDLWANVGAV